MRKEDNISIAEYSDTIKRKVESENSFYYELDPHGSDVSFPYSVLPIRPYAFLDCTRIAIINNASSKIRIKNLGDIEKVKHSLVKATVLMKFALTTEQQSTDFLRNYQITYKSKLLREQTFWSVRYIESDYRFVISTGANLNDSELGFSDVNNRVIPIFGILHSQICELLNELKGTWPITRYEELIADLQQIGLSNNSQHL